jgi:hypothetical protein
MKARWKLVFCGWIAVNVLGGGTTGSVVPVLAHITSDPHRQAGGAVPVNGSEKAFWTAVLRDIGAPASSSDLRALDLWLHREYSGGWAQNTSGGARYNPLDSTEYEPGSTPFNTLSGGGHVWNYPDASEGAQATAVTLVNGHYALIVADLRDGTGLCDSRLAAEFATWSGSGYSGLC